MTEAEFKIDEAVSLILELGDTDGGHHKQWVLDQVLRILLDDKYAETIEEYNMWDEDSQEYIYEWDEGIAP